MNTTRKPLCWNAPPNLKVIDQAISYLRSGHISFSCVALRDAAMAVEGATSERAKLYLQQYRTHAWGPNFDAPYWWSSPYPYRNERITALKAFRKACVEAAKKEQA